MTSSTEGALGRRSQHQMPFGTQVLGGSGVRFQIFAPAAESIRIKLEESGKLLAATPRGDGWHELETEEARPGTRYRFVLPDGAEIPDPASRYQPQDVHGPSEVIDPAAYEWSDEGWVGRPWEEAVLYELHVGTFTQEGTFRSAMEHLDHIAELGATGIELMCLSDFAGNRNWGYDPALLYAPDSAYGRPEDLKAFIDAAHARSLMVILDVVYNHFGPEGNYLPQIFPHLLSERHRTPWGQALNFDAEGSAEVRKFILHNALYWIEEFHVDGLRVDASHAMIDEGPRHVLDDLRDCVQEVARGRRVHLVLENESNTSERLMRDAAGRPESYTAQWNHDITHLLGAVLGKPCEERREDDAGETDRLGKALAKGFVIAAEEKGRFIFEGKAPPTAFVGFIQTHDLIGNRIFGDRVSDIVSQESVRAIAAIYLLLPQIPLIFMGEEWAASTPFPFFCDYHGELADEVRKGRCDQLAKLDPAPSEEEMKRAPDPQADETLRSAQLRWDELGSRDHAELFEWYKRVLQVRQEAVVPLLRGLTGTCGRYGMIGPGALQISWDLAGDTKLHLHANLCAQSAAGFGDMPGKILWMQGTEADGTLGAWTVVWSVESTG